MKTAGFRAIAAAVVLSMTIMIVGAKGASGEAAGEYAKHFEALRKLSISVAQAMPAKEYGFRPHPELMDFGALISHIATTNYQFARG